MTINIVETSYIDADLGDFQISLGANAARITYLEANGTEIGFDIDTSGREIVFQPLPYPARLVMQRQPQAQITFLNGALPPGLTLDASGRISGVVTGVSRGTNTYEFTLRATNEYASRDRTFSISVTDVVSPAAFNPNTLPQTILETQSQIEACDLGTYRIGDPFWYSIDVIQEEFEFPDVDLLPISGLVQTDTLINDLPSGITLTEDRQIIGTVLPSTLPGHYLFQVRINNPIPVVAIFHIEIADQRAPDLQVQLSLAWDTPAGTLGAIQALLPSPQTISASSNRGSIVYSLSPFSSALPIGLDLDPSTGDMRGTPSDGLGGFYTFVARASVGSVFVERSFNLEVTRSAYTDDTTSVYMLLDVPEANREIAGMAAVIPSAKLFQQGDANFGFQTQPKILVINGINAVTDVDIDQLLVKDASAIGHQSFYYVKTFITGQLRCVSVVGTNGAPLYDVIVRDVFDPSSAAGGFDVTQQLAVTEQKVYDRISNVARPIYINSVNNMRCDLINRFGLATKSGNGEDGAPEILDPWMLGDYQLGFAIVFVAPGYGATALKLIQAANGTPPSGNMLYLDKLYFATSQETSLLRLQ